MRITGVEPARLAAQEPKSCMSANSIISASHCKFTTLFITITQCLFFVKSVDVYRENLKINAVLFFILVVWQATL